VAIIVVSNVPQRAQITVVNFMASKMASRA
jgi:hypothetical protein